MGEQVARAGAFAAIFLGLPGTDGRARDLADDGGEDDIAFQFYAAFLERLAGHHEGGDAAFHVRDAQALDFVADDFAGEFGLRLHVGDHAAVFLGAGEARVGVAVESQAQTGAVAFDDADGVGAVEFDVLAHGA